MPVCTTCTQPTRYLYTIYQSAHNLRLEQCTRCNEFVDPYVEHDGLTLLLDLILLKRGVYRHLLFNRGAPPRTLGEGGEGKNESKSEENHRLVHSREQARWMTIFKLGLALIAVDAFIRSSHLYPYVPEEAVRTPTRSVAMPRWSNDFEPYLRMFAGCTIESLAFHLGVTLSCAFLYRMHAMYRQFYRKPEPLSGILREFRLSHVPLTIFYSSLTKLFLLFLLTIWKPAYSSQSPKPDRDYPSYSSNVILGHPFAQYALNAFKDDNLDREWIIRNLLGGMSAGFGLRVVLDVHPAFTTVVILAGWAVKNAVANLIQSWVDLRGRVFLEYSIP